MRDNTCKDVGNQYKALDDSRTRDNSVGQKICQYRQERQCLKTTERKRI